MGYIKQITIQGFKSYKDQTQIEPFSPKSNVIVGRNGSGKSNFFAAVRFVLGDDYHFLNREERQALLHEGSGSAVMSAYVEVCFDNTEDRFQTGKPEFFLRRTIGAKKDEYSMNRKNATKAEVQQTLESAGFSRSNPYYIVPQGRVTALTNMRDSERLTLLKEISGSNVYETRRADSLKLLSDTDHKCNSIDELVASINERLGELEGEKEELEAWSKNDRERRSLIYTMKQREESELEAKLEQIDTLEHNGREIRENNEAMFRQNEEDMAQIESEINQLKGDLELLQDERAQYEADRKEATLAKAKVELELQDLTEGQSVAQKARKRRDAAIKTLQQQIQTREAELQQLLPEYAAKKEQEDAIRSQLLEAESHRKRLEEKQGRTAFYSNKQQRDKALREEINNTNMDLSRRKAVLSQTNDEITQLQSDIERLEREIADLKTSIESEGDNTLNLATQLQQARDSKQALHDEQRVLERELSKIDSEMGTAHAQLRNAEANFSRLLPSDTRMGLDSLRRYQKKHHFPGLHGTIADLLQVPEAYKNVAESAAEGSLFQVVVDNHNVSSKIIEMLNKDRGGRLTFIPLKQMQIRDTEVKTEPDMQPLLPKLAYDPAYEVAFKHVFGKVVVCPNLATCRSKANQYGVHAYTADGDSATQKGRYRGGWRDPSKSQLDAYHRVTQYRAVLDELQNRKDEIIGKLDSKRQELTAATTEVRKRERERDTGESSYGPMRAELRAKENQLLESRNLLSSKQRNAAEIESGINLLSDRQSDLETEITSEFRRALSTDEEQMLVTLASTVKDLRQQAYRLTEERARLESKKADLELELHQNLRPNLDELLAQSTGVGSTSSQSARLKECERALQAVTQNIADFNQKIQEIDDRIEETRGQLGQLETSRTEKETSNRDLARSLEKHEKIMSRKNQDRNLLTERLTAVKRDIRDLGTVPEEAHHKYDRWDTKKISDRLTKVNQAQKKFAHVNKKAFEQYESFTKQRKTLTDRRNELDSSRKSIENLIEVLDQRKDDAIARTFRQVSLAFKDVFKQLVPVGSGRLIIQRRSDAEARQEDDESENERAPRSARNRATVENYTGVGIAVSFNSEHDEQQRISQLSGGQKSLCAMALIFAIQQCDPAPFYLFDEIDANLDAQYRTAVASMLEKLSGKGGQSGDGGGQFICTTFRPEMVLVADKCYGVNYSNKTSSIDVVSRDDALQFVDSTQKT